MFVRGTSILTLPLTRNVMTFHFHTQPPTTEKSHYGNIHCKPVRDKRLNKITFCLRAKHKKYREKQKLSIQQATKVNHACLINKKRLQEIPVNRSGLVLQKHLISRYLSEASLRHKFISCILSTQHESK